MRSAAKMTLIALWVAASPALAKNPNPGVLPPNSHAFGQTYEKLAAAWWIWAGSIPAEENPIGDTTGEFCQEGQSGKVFFLAGTFGTSEERTCTVPTGKAIFFPIANIVCWAPEDVEIHGSLEECVDFFVSRFDILEVEVDGVPLENLEDYEAQSGEFTLPAPDDNIFGLDGERTAMADGFWVLLAPLSSGEHEIDFKGGSTELGFVNEVTYHLAVE